MPAQWIGGIIMVAQVLRIGQDVRFLLMQIWIVNR